MFKITKKIWENEFLRGGAFYSFSSFIIHLMNYFFNFFAGRSLGPKGYGEIVALFSYSTIALIPTAVFSTFLIQKISSAKNQVAYTQALEKLFWLKIKIWWIFAIPTLLIIPFFSKLTNLTHIASGSLFLLVLLSFLSTFYGAALQGLKLFISLSLIGIFATLIKLFGAVIVMVGVDGIEIVILFVIISSAFLFIASFFSVHTHLRKKNNTKLEFIERGILHLLKNRQFVVIFISTLALISFNNIDVIFVKKFFSAKDSGIYASWSLFAKIILYALGPLTTVSFVFFAGNKDQVKQNRAFHLSLVLLLIVAIASFIVYKNFTNIIIFSLFGKKFQEVGPYLTKASLFGSFYTAITFLNGFFLAKNNKLSLILAFCIPGYILLLFVIQKSLNQIINLNILFSAIVTILYIGAYVKEYLKKT